MLMIERVLESLIESKNEAADEVLLDGLRLGSPAEQNMVLEAILRRSGMASLLGVVDAYAGFDERLQRKVLERVGSLHHALRDAGKSDMLSRRVAAISIIAHARQGKLCYVLSENLRHEDEQVSKTAANALTSLARWVNRTTRTLQENWESLSNDQRQGMSRQLVENRSEIEQAVVRALDVHRGTRQVELTDAAALLCDAAGSVTLTILTTARHRGQSALIRRVQQTPADAESVPAFLLAASKGHLRTGFAGAFAKMDDIRVIDAVLRRTHWLADQSMRPCLSQVTGGAFLNADGAHQLCQNASPEKVANVARWVAVVGLEPARKDAVIEQLLPHLGDDVSAKAHVIRSIQIRSRDAAEGTVMTRPLSLLKRLAQDADEAVVRMAVRELMRHRSTETESAMLSMLPTAGESVRKLIGRAVGRSSFDGYWQRFDTMPAEVRKIAGRALLKLLPDTSNRIRRMLQSGSTDDVVKALQMSQELGVLNELRGTILPLCASPLAKVRSKAVMLLGDFPTPVAQVLAEKALADTDARVRANAIEVMEQKPADRFVPALTQRAREGSNRERANAIKALHQMRVSTATEQLLLMLRDNRSEHRISALWAFRRMGLWDLLSEVAKLAKQDGELRVRRYAGAVIQTIAAERNRPRAA